MGIQSMIVCCYHLIAGSNFRSTSSFRIPAFKNEPRLARIRFRQLIAAVKRDILGIVHVLSIHKPNRIRNWGVNNSYGLISGNIIERRRFPSTSISRLIRNSRELLCADRATILDIECTQNGLCILKGYSTDRFSSGSNFQNKIGLFIALCCNADAVRLCRIRDFTTLSNPLKASQEQFRCKFQDLCTGSKAVIVQIRATIIFHGIPRTLARLTCRGVKVLFVCDTADCLILKVFDAGLTGHISRINLI